MKRTVSAHYETRADAERAVEALRPHGLAGHAEIHDVEGSDRQGPHGAHGVHGTMHNLFGPHKDAHVYGEGLLRGHVLLTVKVDESRETLTAEVMEAAQPLDLEHREKTWRAEGWTPPAHPRQAEPGVIRSWDEEASSFGPGIRVRSYIATDTL
jgi:hypothetical protein